MIGHDYDTPTITHAVNPRLNATPTTDEDFRFFT